MSQHVALQTVRKDELISAHLTLELPLSLVVLRAQVRYQAFLVAECLITDVTLEGVRVLMDGLHVPLQGAFSVELLSTGPALFDFSVLMRAHVEVQRDACLTRDVTFCTFVRLIEYACKNMLATVLFVRIDFTTVFTLLLAAMHHVFVFDYFRGNSRSSDHTGRRDIFSPLEDASLNARTAPTHW